MSRNLTYLSGGALLLLLLLAGLWATAAQAQVPGSPPEPWRERSGEPAAPQISFIDSPTPACYQPVPGSDPCYVTWSYLSVTASPAQYVISMTVTIDGQARASHAGFFQTSMYVPGEMYGTGFRVACGAPGAAGLPDLGAAHSYVIRARETGDLTAANYGTVLCPAAVSRVFLPVVERGFASP